MARYRAPTELELAQQKINRQMVDGVGGLEFTAQSPPGVGRLIRIPFYELTATPGFDALTGQAVALIPAALGTASAVSPAIRISAPGIGFSTTQIALLQTPQISWATLRIVGFEVNINEPLNYGTPAMEVCFSDLKVGGGATLFVHEDFAPGSIYLMGQDSFAGLRDYPLLKSPNRAEVAVQGIGFSAGLIAGEGASAPLIFSNNLVCEILVDDNYGAHIPGAYARPGAMVRQGGSFV
jgi:hypothetical protein